MSTLPTASNELITITASFPPQVRFSILIPEIGQRVLDVFDQENWGTSYAKIDVVSEDNMFLFSIGHQVATLTARSGGTWDKYSSRAEKAFDAVFSKYGLDKLTEIVFRKDSLIDTGMSFDEMNELGSEAMLLRPDLVLPGTNDWALTLVKSSEATKEALRVELAPMTTEMAQIHLRGVANVSRNHDIVWGKNLSSLLALVDGDRFCVTSVSSRKEAKSRDFAKFLENSNKGSKEIESAAINRLINLVQE